MPTLKKSVVFCCLLFIACIVQAQTRTISGKVTSAANEAQQGASVVVKGKLKGVATDANGMFSITVPSGSVTLIVSIVGYAPNEKNVGANESVVNFILTEMKGDLEAVVVTALGITRQAKTLVYATQIVKTSELTEARDANNVLNSLQGKIANVVVTQGSGGPGSGARVILRGNRSIQQNSNALIVVDGVPFNNNTYRSANSDFGDVQGSDGASSINPDDIESMNVLRGASAAALYGSEAGNGVIVITTKKGKKDKIAVTLNSGIARESVFALPQFQNSYGQGNGGVLAIGSGESWGAKLDGRSYTNHLGNQSTYSAQKNNVKDFFRNGLSTNNSIGISGGTEKMQTYLSYTNNNIQGIIPKNDLIRHTVNLRLSNQISKRFSTDAKVTYVSQDIKNRPRNGENNAPAIDIYNVARSFSTADLQQYEFINNLGVNEPSAFPSTLSSIYQNPYWMANRYSDNETRDRLIGFITAKFNITDWLSVSGRANLDKTIDKGDTKIYQGTVLWAKQGGKYEVRNATGTNKWFDVMLEGNNKIVNDLKVTYRVGGIFQDKRVDLNSTTTEGGLNVTNKFSLNFARDPAIGSIFTDEQTQAVYGQVNFSFKEAVFLDASLRNEWDSRLPSPYTYQYPSVGVSAIVSDLVTLPNKISFLKTSINYAQVGNGGQFGLLNPVYNYSQGAGNGFLSRSATLPIPGLKPELVKNLEFGVEARFLKNRIGFTATFYKSNSTNQLLRVPLPPASGYNDKYINAGNIENKGFEFVVNGSPIAKRDFSWDVTFNFATNKNKIISLTDDIKLFYLGAGFSRSAAPVVREGGSFGDLVAYKWATSPKGGGLLVNADGKPVIKDSLQTIGNFNPKATIGLTNTFTYKGFSLRILIDGRIGGTVVSGTEMNLAFSGIPAVTEKYREGGWNLGGVDANGQPVTKTITAQDFWQIASGKRYGNGDFFSYDATSFRVREVTFGYSIPLKENKYVKAVKVSFVGRNLFWLYRGKSRLNIPGLGTRKMWFDPDMGLSNNNFQGVEYGNLPSTRSAGLNLQVTF